MKTYYVSVDGGGTSTEFIIANKHKEVLKTYTVGSSSYKSVGIEKMLKNLQKGFKHIFEDFNIEMKDIEHIVFGLSGLDNQKDYDLVTNKILELGIKKEKYTLMNDSILAYYAQTKGPGFVIILGTGGIIFALDKNGKTKRANGWGYSYSDIGSGYWIGNQILYYTLLFCDGVIEYAPIFGKVMSFYKVDNYEDLAYKISEISEVKEIASLSRLMTENIDVDDYVIKEIEKKMRIYFSKAVFKLYKEMNFKEEAKISIVLSGGVFNSQHIRKLIKKSVEEGVDSDKIEYFTQKNSPSLGGIHLMLDNNIN